MNKSPLVQYVAGELHTSRHRASQVVETVLGGITEGLRADKNVTLTGFGTFEVKERKPRVGRNPHTGAPIPIGAGHRIGFRVGKTLKDSV